MRLEIAQLHESLTTTMIYVTHDQIEAMTLADKIVVLNSGNIEQAGSPLELYHHPVNLFVAGFIGSPKMNFITGAPAAHRGATTIGVRPEHLKVDAGGQGWPGKVVIAEHLGSDTFLYVDAGPLGTLTVRGAGEIGVKMGDQVTLVPDPNRIYRFDANGNAVFA
jgi:multiple sugar transport system ATP-binding protein